MNEVGKTKLNSPVNPLPEKIHRAFQTALDNGLEWDTTNRSVPNSLRSAKFLSELGGCLDQVIYRDSELKGRYIGIDEDDERKEGEWLLDGVWAKEIALPGVSMKRESSRIPVQLLCALECESSTNGHQFFRDFSKLLVVSSPLKIFAAGLNQGTRPGVENYVRNRIDQVEKLLSESSSSESATDWYIAFWPSPSNINGESLWRQLSGKKYSRLRNIRLFHRSSNTKGRFREHFQSQPAP